MDHFPDSTSRISRFVFNGEFSKHPKLSPRPNAFDLERRSGQINSEPELSVSDSDNIGRDELVLDGNFVATRRGRTLRGWIHLPKAALETLQLRIVSDPQEGFERHSLVLDWSIDEVQKGLKVAMLIRESHIELL